MVDITVFHRKYNVVQAPINLLPPKVPVKITDNSIELNMGPNKTWPQSYQGLF